jgi:hypothetical protein
VRIKDFVSLETRLLEKFPGFAIKGQLMFMIPLEHTLRGFHFDGSSFNKKSLYVDAFFMPLCVPTEHVHFTFGRRVRDKGGDRWNADDLNFEAALESAMQEEVPFLARLRTAKDVSSALEPLTKPNDAGYVNPHCYEALAYTLVQAGETTAAANVIDTLLKRASSTVAWESEIASRARLIRNKLLEGPEKAQQQLTVWESENIRNLELENFQSDLRGG